MSRLFQKWSEKEIRQVLLALRDEAYDLGASKVAIIEPGEVVVDDRVRYKCMWSCPHYNTSLMCPPYTPRPEETRRLLNQYRYALLVRREGPAEDFVGGNAIEERSWIRHGRDLHKTMLKLESSAFYRGFYLAIAMVGGCCRICYPDGACQGLEQGRCLHPYESRPSMEALGIDVLSTLDKLGWEVQVVGRESKPSEIRIMGFVGLLLVC